MLDIGTQRIGARSQLGLDPIDPFIPQLDHHVASHVHFICVVACATHQHILASTADQCVIARVAQDDVVARQPIQAVAERGSFDGVCCGRAERARDGIEGQDIGEPHGATRELKRLDIANQHAVRPASEPNIRCVDSRDDVIAIRTIQHQMVPIPGATINRVFATVWKKCVVTGPARQRIIPQPPISRLS